MGLSELSAVLWQQRELLDLLQFKLETEALILTHGQPRYLARATDEIEFVLAELRKVELLRATHGETTAVELGLHAEATLAQMAEVAPSPWGEMLDDHRSALLAAVAEISATSMRNRDLLAAGARAAQETINALRNQVEEPVAASTSYTASGSSAGTDLFVRILDQAF
jgi:FlgN protein